MADFLNSIAAPEILRPLIESEIERLIALLDGMDADPDLEPCCEDEGAQCDDEGSRECT